MRSPPWRLISRLYIIEEKIDEFEKSKVENIQIKAHGGKDWKK